jgi:hypothetical protein
MFGGCVHCKVDVCIIFQLICIFFFGGGGGGGYEVIYVQMERRGREKNAGKRPEGEMREKTRGLSFFFL